ncbi:hypothetical protein ACVJBD_007209 [Rhizobium mongolense]
MKPRYLFILTAALAVAGLSAIYSYANLSPANEPALENTAASSPPAPPAPPAPNR